MIGSYAGCDGCGLRIDERVSHPDFWIRVRYYDQPDQYYCSKECLLANVGQRPGETKPAWPFGLTARQVDLLTHIAKGLSNKELAEAIGVPFDTVRNELHDAYAKLGVEDRCQAILAAQALHVLNLPSLADEFYGERLRTERHTNPSTVDPSEVST